VFYAAVYAGYDFKADVDAKRAKLESQDDKSSEYSLVFSGISCNGVGSILTRNLGDTAKYPNIVFMSVDYKVDQNKPDDPNCQPDVYQKLVSQKNVETFKQINTTIQTIQ
jgi:hypothetical protein